MKHIAVALAFMTPVLGQAQDSQDAVKTPFGVVSIADSADGRYLAFRGRAVIPRVEANNSLSFEKTVKFNDSVAILVANYGGTACPVENLYWLVIGKNGYKLSPSFGTCSEFYKFESKDGKLVVTMPGFKGPFDSTASQTRALKERHVFTYDGQRLVKSKSIAKQEWQE